MGLSGRPHLFTTLLNFVESKGCSFSRPRSLRGPDDQLYLGLWPGASGVAAVAEAAATPDVVDLQSPCQSERHLAISACKVLLMV